MIRMIWAQGARGELGINNGLPWHLPEDLQHFKNKTIGSVVVMGRSTYESLGKPLPGRINIVLSRHVPWFHPNVWVYNDINKLYQDTKGQLVNVIGGRTIYDAFMPLASELLVTKVHGNFKADTYAPAINDSWGLAASEHGISATGLEYTFETYRGKQ